jgi:hypothetical protein
VSAASTTGEARRAIRETAARNDLPVERITQVRVLGPYFHAYIDDAKA